MEANITIQDGATANITIQDGVTANINFVDTVYASNDNILFLSCDNALKKCDTNTITCDMIAYIN